MPEFDTFMNQWTNGQRSPCIACLGDSVTAGYTTSGVIDHVTSYPARLRKAANAIWPLVVTNVINAGVAGDTVKGALARLERDALVHRPTVLIIAFGLNDSGANEDGLAAFKANLKTMIDQAKAQDVKWLVLVTPPMMATQENYHVQPQDLVHAPGIIRRQNKGVLAQYAQAICNVGQSLNVPVADVHAQWEALAASGVDTNAMLANGLNHPTSAAHAIHALTIWEALRTTEKNAPVTDSRKL